jgi:hypothetical protein
VKQRRRWASEECRIVSFQTKERALTSPKTSALAFISVLPWRINDGGDTTLEPRLVGCVTLINPSRGYDKSFSKLSSLIIKDEDNRDKCRVFLRF